MLPTIGIITRLLAVASAADLDVDPCAQQLAADGCLAAGTHCDACASHHANDLGRANCTRKEVARLCSAAPAPAPAPTAPMQLVLLQHGAAGSPGGLCLDGSLAGFYYGRPNGTEHGSDHSNANATQDWVLSLDGGGACYTEEDCKKRAGSKLGSSKDWAHSCDGCCPFCGTGPADQFAHAHRVKGPYCTGDTYVGTRTTASNETWGPVPTLPFAHRRTMTPPAVLGCWRGPGVLRYKKTIGMLRWLFQMRVRMHWRG